LANINISNTALTGMPALPSNLYTLEAANSSLLSLPPLPSTLQYLNVNNTRISGLPTLPLSLQRLAANDNPNLVSLPTLPDQLSELNCSNCPLLQTIPNFPTTLYTVNCKNNPALTSLPPIPASVSQFNASGCSLTALPAFVTPWFNYNLYEFNLSGNPLGSVPFNYSWPRSISHLRLDSCSLVSLPSLPSDVSDISLAKNPGLKCLPLLSGYLNSLNIRGTGINCLPNLPGSFGIHLDADFPYDRQNMNNLLCNPTNNSSGCIAYPSISGNVFYDFNNNGTQDIGEPVRENSSVSLYKGSALQSGTFTNTSGYYQFITDTIGTITLKNNAPLYFKSVPDTVLINLTSSSITQNFALQTTQFKDSLRIFVTPHLAASRPGFSYPYSVNYRNEGSTNLTNVAVELRFDSSKLTYDSSSNPAVINAGNRLVLQVGSLPFGMSGYFSAYFTIKTTVTLASTLTTTGVIEGMGIVSTDTSRNTITGSYDPNDKNGTPLLRPEQVTNGKYIDYTIRCQNTGNDTAFHVVIADTLSNMLQWNTLEMISSSHLTKATVKDGIVNFEMRNILLPDSNRNEPASHGYVRFRIKPKSSVVVGSDIPNTAAIYFDYNAPVITNTFITQVRNADVLPLKLVRFKGVRAGNADHLYWNTANEVNTKWFEIERSTDSRKFSRVGYVHARGGGNGEYNFTTESTGNTTYYRLKTVDVDGAFQYSNIIVIKGESKAAIVLANNPVTDKLVITILSSSLANTEAKLINSAGVVVRSFVLKGTGTQIIAIDFPSGVYYLRTLMGSEKVVVTR
jgi:uncharacterized repeat protein (TIGR01451 family)